MGPEALAQVLRPIANTFDPADYPDLLRGLDRPDDAGVMRLNDELALVMTADFFPPVVDDPYWYGAIAAANALSDVYAMGGRPIMALNLAAFPDDLDASIISEILRGGAEKVREAGAVISGGHTTVDPEPKYGLSVSGLVDPDAVFANEGAKPGDIICLTKPIGTGIATTAHKRSAIKTTHLDQAIASMARLNAGAAKILRDYADSVHAVTDVTGFSLAGHAHEMAHLSGVCLRVDWAQVPLLEDMQTYAAAGHVTGGGSRNQDFYGQWMKIGDHVAETDRALLFDPQTSGGLLCALAAENVDAIEAWFRRADEPFWRIGDVTDGPSGSLEIK